jgi:hypothetical protein
MTKFTKMIGLALIGLAIAGEAPVALAKSANRSQQDEKALCAMDVTGACVPGAPAGWSGSGEGGKQQGGDKKEPRA